jgi:hypothetical protein
VRKGDDVAYGQAGGRTAMIDHLLYLLVHVVRENKNVGTTKKTCSVKFGYRMMKFESINDRSSQTYKQTHELDRLAKILTLILLIVGACVFIWGSDKSFDFTDEGLYLLVYQNPQEFPDRFPFYH